MFCRKCGSELADDSRFCAKCGTAVQLSESPKGGEVDRKRKPIGLIIGACLALCAVVVGLFIYNKVQTTNYLKLMATGAKQFDAQEWLEAIDTYEDAIEIKPREAAPYLRLAKIYYEQGNNEEAQKILSEGYKKTKSDEIELELSYFSSIGAAESAIADGDFASAAVHLEVATNVKPDVVENYLLLAKSYVEQWDLYNASETLQRGYTETSDKRLLDVSIWGPLSVVETVLYAMDEMPFDRCEYRFCEDEIYSYLYIQGTPLTGASYICEEGQVKYVSILDYDHYGMTGLSPKQILPCEALSYLLLSFDLEYNDAGELSGVSYEGNDLISINHSNGQTTLTAQVDYNGMFSAGDSVNVIYNEVGRIEKISVMDDYSANYSFASDGSYSVSISEWEGTTLGFSAEGLFVSITGDDADAFDTVLENGKIVSLGNDQVQYHHRYDGDNLVELTVETDYIENYFCRTISYTYEKVNGLDRPSVITLELDGQIIEQTLLTYNSDGTLNTIEDSTTIQSYVYSDGQMTGYIVSFKDGVTEDVKYLLKYDYAGRFTGRSKIE